MKKEGGQVMTEYSAGLTSQLFWLQETRKTASLITAGMDKAAIRKVVWEENIYQVKAEYRAIEILNHTFRRVSLLPEEVCTCIASCDIETAKIINLIAVMMDSRLLFEFMHDVFTEKRRLGEKEITDRDMNVFFEDKAMQSEVVAGWTDVAMKKLKQSITRMLFEAGLLESGKRPAIIHPAHIDYRTAELLNSNGLGEYLKAITGE